MAVHSLARALSILSSTLRRMHAAKTSPLPLSEQKRAWAEEMLGLLNVRHEAIGTACRERPAVFVGNHVSYIDILLLLAHAPDLSFVAKQELARWPLFGRGMRMTDTVFVQRDSVRSRGAARETLRCALEAGRGIVIFPAGTTSLREEVPWKPGAFRLAEESGAMLQPFRISYRPLRAAAFIGDDAFLPHLWKACRTRTIRATLEFGTSRSVASAVSACQECHRWVAEGLTGLAY